MTEMTATQLPRPQSGEHLYQIAQETPRHRADWTPVAFYPELEEGADPADVTVLAYGDRAAVFYRIASEKAGIDLTTGTDPRTRLGMHDLAHAIAEAICSGMLGVSEDDQR